MKTFVKRIKSPIVLSGILSQIVVIALLYGINPEAVEMWRLIAIAVLEIYTSLFVSTNNPLTKNKY